MFLIRAAGFPVGFAFARPGTHTFSLGELMQPCSH